MREGAATRVLSDETDGDSFAEKRSVGHCFTQGPVDFAFGIHFVAKFELGGELRMKVEAIRG